MWSAGCMRRMQTAYRTHLKPAINAISCNYQFFFALVVASSFLSLSHSLVATAAAAAASEIDSRVTQKCGGCLNASRKIRGAYQLEKQFTDLTPAQIQRFECAVHGQVIARGMRRL